MERLEEAAAKLLEIRIEEVQAAALAETLGVLTIENQALEAIDKRN